MTRGYSTTRASHNPPTVPARLTTPNSQYIYIRKTRTYRKYYHVSPSHTYTKRPKQD